MSRFNIIFAMFAVGVAFELVSKPAYRVAGMMPTPMNNAYCDYLDWCDALLSRK